MVNRRAPALWALLFLLSACSGKGVSVLPLTGGSAGVGVFDASTTSCVVTYDGLLWYAVPAGSFAPIDVAHEQCAPNALQAKTSTPVPSWAKPSGGTHTIFVAASLQEKLPLGGMQILENIAQAHHVPVTWLVGSADYLLDPQPYNADHTQNGDDVEAEPNLEGALRTDFPWYTPLVSAQVGGAGRAQRDPAAAMTLGEDAFWGTAWNQLGIDQLQDYGTPWGTYCAEVTSFKRPSTDSSCALLAFEWTARDLDRAYYSGQVAAYSTDPDDLLQRGGFTAQTALPYVNAIMDAYAAAGESQPIAIVSQQESQEMFNAGDSQVMAAIYARAVTDGMKLETLARASADARAFSAKARAIAFPFIAGGKNVASAIVAGATIYPSTIDYHDGASGMTFVAGRTAPSRVFRYSDYPLSRDDSPIPEVPASQLPVLMNAAVSSGVLSFELNAPVALHYGLAIWSDPATLGLAGQNVHAAGHAGAVLTFDLQPGENEVSFPCTKCTGTTFTYST